MSNINPAPVATKVNAAANTVLIVNGLDIVLGALGIVPVGTIPAVASGIITIVAGVTSWLTARRAKKAALYTPAPLR